MSDVVAIALINGLVTVCTILIARIWSAREHRKNAQRIAEIRAILDNNHNDEK
jgi:hypothetical protein